MAKKKLARSSTMQQTVKEGKGFTGKIGKRIRKPAVHIPIQFPTVKRVRKMKKNVPSRPVKAIKPKKHKKKSPRPVRAAIPSQPARTIGKTSSKNSMGSALEHELVQRLDTNSATYGKLNFSLRWYDPNDLDLHVICPCGTQIYYGNKKCQRCEGELDIDMNNCSNPSLEPVEHVFFNKAKPGTYKYFCKYFSKKDYQGVKGKDVSRYILTIHTQDVQLQRFEETACQTKNINHQFTI